MPAGVHLDRRRSQLRGRDPGRDGRLRGGHPRRRRLPPRHPGGRPSGDVRGQRRGHRARARCRDRARPSRGSSHVSTANVFGNTHGRIVDEKYRRDPGEGFLSYYDETKYRAHVAAKARIAAGAPIVIVDARHDLRTRRPFGLGAQLKAAYAGTARYVVLGDSGISPTYVDDLAAGIVAAMDRGRLGETLCARRREHAPARRDADRRPMPPVAVRPALSDPDRLSSGSPPASRRAPRGSSGCRAEPAARSSARRPASPTGRAAPGRRPTSGTATRDLERGARDAFGRP